MKKGFRCQCVISDKLRGSGLVGPTSYADEQSAAAGPLPLGTDKFVSHIEDMIDGKVTNRKGVSKKKRVRHADCLY
jgi:hypothetical protein